MQQYEGIIKLWKVDKGFGFIQPNAGGNDVFIHIRDLQHINYQPQQGDKIKYKIVADKDGKIRAYEAFIRGQEIKKPQPQQTIKYDYQLGMLPRLIIAIIPFVFSALLIKQQHNFIPFFTYFIVSLLTFIVYTIDKTKAHNNQWRIPEKTLHLLELFGGWPGALITQRAIRHKNKKMAFQIVFWLIVLIHIAIWVDVLFLNTNGVLCKLYSLCNRE